MNDMIGILVVATAILCLYLAQRKNAPKQSQRLYSLLGGVACILVTFEAARRSEGGVMVLFASGAVVSLFTVLMDFLNPGKPDA